MQLANIREHKVLLIVKINSLLLLGIVINAQYLTIFNINGRKIDHKKAAIRADRNLFELQLV